LTINKGKTMNKMLTRTALVSSLVLAGASYSNAQTTVSGNLFMTYKAIKNDQANKQQYRGFGKESQINLTNKGKLNNGMDYVAGFSIELDGSDSMAANVSTSTQAGNSLPGAFNENTYIDFISGNTTFTIGADHIQNPDFAVSNLVGIADPDDLMNGIGTAKAGTPTAMLFPTTKNSAYESYGFGIVQKLPIGNASINYVPNATTGVAAADTNGFNTRSNIPSIYDGISKWEVGFQGDLGVKGLTASAFYNRSVDAGSPNTTGQYIAAKYNTGDVTVALGRADQQAIGVNASAIDTKAYELGIAYAISKDVSIGYTATRTEKDLVAAKEKIQQISLGYSLGPIATGITVGSIKNLGGTDGV
ncbi:porin, partial [bacterium]|nr:porin [bacterium]